MQRALDVLWGKEDRYRARGKGGREGRGGEAGIEID